MTADPAPSSGLVPAPIARLDDSALIRRCLDRDEEAWRELVTRYARLVYSIPRRAGLQAEECQDVFQQVFAALVTGLPNLRDPQSLGKWLMTTAQRWTIRVRAGRLDDREDMSQQAAIDASLPADLLEQWDLQHRVRQALRELGGPCEELLTMLYLRGERPEYAAIGRSLGIPVGSIGPTRARCLAKLRRVLQGRGTGSDGADPGP